MTKSLFLNVWYKCNYDCVYCVIWWIQEEFESEDFVSLEKIKSINLEWYKSVWITWWEPTIHPQIFKILDYFYENDIEMYMQTNWSMLWNQDFFQKIKKYNIKFQLPLNSNIEKIHNVIMKHKNAFNLTLKGIKNIVSYNSDLLTVKIILTRLNYNTIAETVEFLYNLWVKKFYIAYPILKWNYLKYLDKLVPTYTKIKPHLEKLVPLEEKYGIEYLLDWFPYCILNEKQYKNEWEIGQLDKYIIEKSDEGFIKEALEISINCYKKYWDRSEDRNCNTCKIIDLKDRLNNVSFLHKKLDKEINANCLDNLHKSKNDSCLECNYNIICSWVSKEYIKLFWFKEFKNDVVKEKITKNKIIKYLDYVTNV